MQSIRSAVTGPELRSYETARAELGGEPWKAAPDTEAWFLPSPTAARALEAASPLDEPASVYSDSFVIRRGWSAAQRLSLMVAVGLVLIGAGMAARTRASELATLGGRLAGLLVHSSSPLASPPPLSAALATTASATTASATTASAPTATTARAPASGIAPTVGPRPSPVKLARVSMSPSVRALFDRGGKSPEPRKRGGKAKSGRSRRHSAASRHHVRSRA